MKPKKIIDEISEIRRKNNENWMAILQLAFKHSPDEAKAIMKEVVKCDQQVTKLTEKLTR